MELFKKFVAFTEGGNADKMNEDLVAVAENYAIVMDGATGLIPGNITGSKDDVAWYVNEFYKNAQPLFSSDMSLKSLLKEALIKTNSKYEGFADSVKPEIYPSSGICVVRINGDKLEFFMLGDCPLAVKFKNDEVKLYQIDHLKKLDQINIDKMSRIAKEKGINITEARGLINDDLIATRLLMNTPKGYYILSANAEAVDKGYYDTIPLKDIKSIFGCSDGFSQIYDTFNAYSLEDIFNQLESGKTLKEFCEEIRAIQEKDSNCNRYPRFKKSDDASAFFVEI